jgi:hypothetical protein
VISPSRRPLSDNTQQTNIQALGGIRTHNLSRQADADPLLRPRGHWDRADFQKVSLTKSCLFSYAFPPPSQDPALTMKPLITSHRTTGWVTSPFVPVQERCCTVLAVRKFRTYNAEWHMSPVTCRWLSTVTTTATYILLPTGTTGTFRSPCITFCRKHRLLHVVRSSALFSIMRLSSTASFIWRNRHYFMWQL